MMVLYGSRDLVGLLAHRVFLASNQRVLVAGRVPIADFGSVGVGIAKAFLRVHLNELSRLPVLMEQLGVSSFRFIPRRVLPELCPCRHLGALGLVQTMAEDISESVGGILD